MPQMLRQALRVCGAHQEHGKEEVTDPRQSLRLRGRAETLDLFSLPRLDEIAQKLTHRLSKVLRAASTDDIMCGKYCYSLCIGKGETHGSDEDSVGPGSREKSNRSRNRSAGGSRLFKTRRREGKGYWAP